MNNMMRRVWERMALFTIMMFVTLLVLFVLRYG